MFGIKIFRRNRLSSLRLMVLAASCFLIYLLIQNFMSFPDVADMDGISSIYYTGEELDISEENNVLKKANINTGKIPIDGGQPRPSIDRPVPKTHKVPVVLEKSLPIIHDKVEKPLPTAHDKHKQRNVEKMAATIKKLNHNQNILNLEKFPKRNSNGIVIVVQVHKRVNYLVKLVKSLKNARGISNALLIFSHDYIASDIDKLIRSINFCQVLQIYFPYSEQLHQDEFPGTDPNDCPRDKHIVGCNNAEHPDTYGHYREAKFTMTKHHWWWKANRVFKSLHQTRNHQGLVLFLEEDHYVAPDFYEVLQKAYSTKKTSKACHEQGCDIITLGNYKNIFSLQEHGSDVEIQPWKSIQHNMGMAFDRKTWNEITECSKVFCTYDDYNWDWTLMKISAICLKKPLTVLLVKAARVFHVGTCGLHHKNGNCNVETVIDEVETIILNGAKFLYPKKLVVHMATPWIRGSPSRPNGGWGDIRDHELCLQFSQSTE